MRVFITGCSSGIGRATALLMLRSGYRVIATARNPESLQTLARDAGTSAPNLVVARCDLRDVASIEQAWETACETFGGIDILVNNAGYAAVGPVEMIPVDQAERQFAVNVFGAVRLVQLAALRMRQAGSGLIISVSSIAGRMLVPLSGWYSASKFALEAINDALRFELSPDGIRVVSILPGPVETDFMRNLEVSMPIDDAPEVYRRYMDHYAARREQKRPFVVPPESVAKLILRVAENRSPRPRYYITFPSRLFGFSRRWFTDRMWDRLTKRAYGFDKIDKEYAKWRSGK